MAICYLVGAGEFTARDFAPTEDDLIIAADGGYAPLASLGIKPHLLVGDFDSLAVRPTDVPVRTFPVEKDDTDMGLALTEGIQRGYSDFVLYGADGGRMDHFLANLQIMGGASKDGLHVHMVGKDFDVYTVTNDTLTLPVRERGTVVSVLCHGASADGVTLKGLKYPLNEALLTCDHPLGVSNQYIAEHASVTVGKGTLLVFVALRPM